MTDKAPDASPVPAAPPVVANVELKAALLLILMVVLVAGAALYLMYARGAFESTQQLVLIADDAEGVAGYCLAARDTRAFAAWCEASWWPALRDQYPRRDDGSPDAALIELLHAPPVAPDELLDAYPAHLHIDLLERVRGTGLGRRLIERQLADLAAANVAGCHLGAASTNTNAIAFYEHLGWRVLRRDDHDCVMGIVLR